MNKEEKEQTIQDLELIKNYFGENDKTAFQHMAFDALKKHIDYLSSQSDRVEMPTKELSEITDDEIIEFFDLLWHENHSEKTREYKLMIGKSWIDSYGTNGRLGMYVPFNFLQGLKLLISKGYGVLGLSLLPNRETPT